MGSPACLTHMRRMIMFLIEKEMYNDFVEFNRMQREIEVGLTRDSDSDDSCSATSVTWSMESSCSDSDSEHRSEEIRCVMDDDEIIEVDIELDLVCAS